MRVKPVSVLLLCACALLAGCTTPAGRLASGSRTPAARRLALRRTLGVPSRAPSAWPLWAAPSSRRVVALTFDDGPDPRFTPAILQELTKQSAVATFFVLGASAQAHPKLLRREVQTGSEVGCHGWDHRLELAWGPAHVVGAFRRCAVIVERATGRRPTLARAPYGLLRSDQVAALRAAGFSVVDWTLSASPALHRPAVWARDLNRMKSGSIVLLHDGRGDRSSVVRALPDMIETLRAHGFTLVTVSQLLSAGQGALEPARVECGRVRYYERHGIVPPAALRLGLCVA